MKRTMFFLFLLTISFSFGTRAYARCSDFDPQWMACEKDSDCAETTGACGGPAAFNKNYLAAVEDHHDCIRPMILCAPRSADVTFGQPLCKTHQCVLPPKR